MKPLSLLNNKIEAVVEKFCARSKVKLLGSNAVRGMLYPSDTDVECLASNIPASELAKRIQTAVSHLGDTILVEFKTEDGTKKLRWSSKDILKGFKGKVSLADALTKKGVMKADMIVPVGDTFAEVSVYYVITVKGETNVPELSGTALIESLDKDVQEYRKHNVLKALKRYYSIQKVKGKQSQPIEDFLNSETGAVSKARGDLELIPHLIGKVSVAKIQNFLSVIKQNLGNTTVNEEWLNIDTWKAKTMKKHVKQLTDRLLAWTNAETKAFIKKQKLKI